VVIIIIIIITKQAFHKPPAWE